MGGKLVYVVCLGCLLKGCFRIFSRCCVFVKLFVCVLWMVILVKWLCSMYLGLVWFMCLVCLVLMLFLVCNCVVYCVV